jgi:hypothetical protein
METPQQYTQRILGHVGEQEPLKVQAATAKKIERLIAKASPSKLRKRPAPGKWSVAEIVTHLADAEIVIGYRVRSILGAPGTPIQAFDQDAWVTALHYDKRSAGESLDHFRALRSANLALYKTLSKEQWEQFGMHSERGRESVQHIVQLIAGHDLNHLRQIESALKV